MNTHQRSELKKPTLASAVTRREFVRGAALAIGTVAAPWVVCSSAIGADGATPPSERITTAVIGVGAMGRGHTRRLAGDRTVQLVALCDVDRTRREAEKKTAEQIIAARQSGGTFRGCEAYNDFREVLARPDIDAVAIATPDHWHSLLSIEAARAGKDVYCEKPVSICIQEGRRLVEAIQRYGRVFQTGTQYRTSPTIRTVCDFVRKGGLGKVRSAFTILTDLGGFVWSERHKPYAQVFSGEGVRASIAPLDFALPGEPVPDGLDWDLWVGPAPWRPYNFIYHQNPSPGVVPWSFCEDFGAAASTWYLSHAADVMQYALGVEESGPVEIIHPSTKQFPTLTCRYANGTLLHFVNHWGMVKDVYKAVPANARLDGLFGGLFVGERGWVTSMTGAGPIEGGPVSIFEEMGLKSRTIAPGFGDHHANWLDCIRTRKQPSSHEEIGHRSSSLGLLAFAACKLNRSLTWNPATEEFVGDDEANRLRSRSMRPPWRI